MRGAAVRALPPAQTTFSSSSSFTLLKRDVDRCRSGARISHQARHNSEHDDDSGLPVVAAVNSTAVARRVAGAVLRPRPDVGAPATCPISARLDQPDRRDEQHAVVALHDEPHPRQGCVYPACPHLPRLRERLADLGLARVQDDDQRRADGHAAGRQVRRAGPARALQTTVHVLQNTHCQPQLHRLRLPQP